MRAEIQWYLIEHLAQPRASLHARPDYESRQQQLAAFSGALAAFRYVGEIDQGEDQHWRHRLLEALGYEVPEPGPPGSATAIYVGDPARRPEPTEVSPVPPLFIQSTPGPDVEIDVHGGTFRVLAIEIYDVQIVIRWRAAPMPETWLAFPEEAAALEQDLAGIEDEWAKTELRRKAEFGMHRFLMHGFELTDDVGTTYSHDGGGGGGQPRDWTGDAHFKPAPPPQATLLTLNWLGTGVVLPLR